MSCCDEVDCVESSLLEIKTFLYDNTGQSQVKITQDSSAIPAAGFKMALQFIGEETHRGPCIASANFFTEWFQNRALATKCPSPEYTSPDTLDHITIRSTKPFNQNYPSGSDLFELFVVDGTNGNSLDAMSSMPYWGNESDILNLLLFATPDSTRMHQFIVDVYMTSGRVVSDTTLNIALTP